MCAVPFKEFFYFVVETKGHGKGNTFLVTFIDELSTNLKIANIIKTLSPTNAHFLLNT